MKYKLAIFASSLAIMICQAQTSTEDITFQQNANTINGAAGGGLVTSGVTGIYSGRAYSAARGIEGDKYLFDTWANKAIVATNGGQFLSVNNVNFDMERGTFTFKDEGKIYDINQFSVKNITINNRLFKRVVSPRTNVSRLMEVIYENNQWAVLKDQKVKIRDGKFDVNRGQLPDKFVKDYDYLMLQDDTLKRFKIKTRKLNGIYGPHKEAMREYIKVNELSYKDDKDLRMIFRKFSNLQSDNG